MWSDLKFLIPIPIPRPNYLIPIPVPIPVHFEIFDSGSDSDSSQNRADSGIDSDSGIGIVHHWKGPTYGQNRHTVATDIRLTVATSCSEEHNPRVSIELCTFFLTGD